MHSQAELIQHLTTMRRLLVERHAEVAAGSHSTELCLCRAIEEATDQDIEHPMQVAVKQMIQSAFADDGQEYHKHRYIWPVAVTNRASLSESGFRGTQEEVAEGYTKRLALIDRWIADAKKKLLAAVFRKAIDELERDWFMCLAVKRAANILMDKDDDGCDSSALGGECLEVLHLFMPRTHDRNVDAPWFEGKAYSPRGRALRVAILNLCVTEVTRGFK